MPELVDGGDVHGTMADVASNSAKRLECARIPPLSFARTSPIVTRKRSTRYGKLCIIPAGVKVLATNEAVGIWN